MLATELAERDRMLQTIHSMRGYANGGGGSMRGGGGGGDGDEDDVAMQVRICSGERAVACKHSSAVAGIWPMKSCRAAA